MPPASTGKIPTASARPRTPRARSTGTVRPRPRPRDAGPRSTRARPPYNKLDVGSRPQGLVFSPRTGDTGPSCSAHPASELGGRLSPFKAQDRRPERKPMNVLERLRQSFAAATPEGGEAAPFAA